MERQPPRERIIGAVLAKEVRLPAHPDTSLKPKFRPPKGAWDAHFHVFGPIARFPYAEARPFTPPEASRNDLFAMHARLGVERGVLVQSAVHGFDHTAAIDAIAGGGGLYRGVALLPLGADAARIRSLDAAGFRAARFNFVAHLGSAPAVEDMIAFAHRLADHGWHLQIHFDPASLADLTPALMRSPTPVVIDHMGRMDASLGVDQPHFRQLLTLLEDDRFWVKLSGCERASRLGAPYQDAVPLARKLMTHCGDRTLWGTDWPHPNVADPPNDALLLDLIPEMAPGEAEQKALLIDNPGRLFGAMR